MFRWLTFIIIMLLLVILGQQIFLFGTSDDKLLSSSDSFTIKSLTNTSYYSVDYLVKAAEKSNDQGNFQLSEQLAISAIKNNITSGSPFTYLLGLYSSRKQTDAAYQVATLATKLWPVHSDLHTRLADFWFHQGDIEKMLDEWNILLTRNPSLETVFFPAMQFYLNQEIYFSFFEKQAKTLPIWLNHFFQYVTNTSNIDTVTKLYEIYEKNSSFIPNEINQSYVNYLLKNNQVSLAYKVWSTKIATLNRENNYIYDGDFEKSSNNTGFDWSFYPSKNIDFSEDMTYGSQGLKSLKIVFKKNLPVNSTVISQHLLLPIGKYQFSMKYRLDSFKSGKGLKWQIACSNNSKQVIAETENIINGKSWTNLVLDFEVPTLQYCDSQLIKLVASSQYRHEQFFEGTAWFDQLKIQSLETEKQ